MHGLDARGVDEDLEHRARLGQIRDQVGIELQRQVRLGLAGRVGLEVVRAQDGADDAEEPAQDPVLVEALDRVDRALELALQRARLRVGILGPRRIEPHPEQLHEPARDVGVREERILLVRLAEGAARLAQVLGDRAQDRDLARGEPGRDHEPVEAVVLGLAAPGAREGVLERLTHVVGVQLRGPVVAEAEVVDPDRRPVGRFDLVRPLVADADAHVLEQRQYVREERRLAGADELEGEVVERRLEWDVQAHAEVAVRVEPFDPLDVVHRLARGEVLPVGARERLAVALEERTGPGFAELFRERVAEIVRPGSRRGGQPSLDLGDVELRHGALLGVDDEVEARQHRLGHAGRVVDARAGERLLEDLLDPLPVLRVEPLARHVDEAGEEASERVPPHEESHPAALAEVENAERGREQLVLGDLEELVARVRLEDLDERLVVVAALGQARPLDDALRLAAQDRDLPRARAVRGVGVEAEEAPFADDLARSVEALDAHVIEVRGPVHGRPGVRLRQRQQALRAREPPHLGRQLGEADRDRPLVAGPQDPEPRARDRPQHLLPVLRADVVRAVAEEREVVVVHPREQVARLRQLIGVDGRRRRGQSGEHVVDALPHRRPLLDRGAHVGEHAREVGSKPLQFLGAGLAVDLDVDHRLGLPVLGADFEQPALLVPADADDRPDHEVDRAPLSRHLHRDRIDEEGHVVDDRLDDGVRRLPAVLLDIGRVDVHLRLAGLPDAREVPVRDGCPVEVEVAPVVQVVGSDVGVVRAHEPLDVPDLRRVDPLADARHRRLEQRCLSLIRARRHGRTQYDLARRV